MTIAIAGNPNSGKTALFNLLTGSQQKIANFPGVTVEKKLGSLKGVGANQIAIIDLPGTYSLDADSPDERIAQEILLGKQAGTAKPDLILVVADATHLERSLFLVSQLIDYRLPLILCLNMYDLISHKGLRIDCDQLSSLLGVPVVPTVATKGVGKAELLKLLTQSQWSPPRPQPELSDIAEISDPKSVISKRHEWCEQLVARIMTKERETGSLSDQIDHYLLHPLLGPLVFMAVMVLVFQSVFDWAAPLTAGLDWLSNGLAQWLHGVLPSGIARDLLVDGVIGGVGAVIVFIPQIMILFLFITLLEDSGYLSRAAFLVDRLMVRSGLSGKSFIPLLSSFACAIPGIMATRTIKDDRDRLATIMVAPLMTCSARLPVYVLLIGAFIPAQLFLGFDLQALVLLGLYLLGILGAVVVAKVMRVTVLKGPKSMLILELPDYKIPSLKNLRLVLWVRLKLFLFRAGKIILTASIILWFLSNFPRMPDPSASQVAQMEYSYAGKLGHAIEPLLRPLGYDWKVGIGLIASFAAREVFVATMGTLYNVADANELTPSLRLALTRDPVFNIPMVLGLLVFFAFAMQCVSTVAVMRRETNSWRWPIVAVLYTYALAYFTAYLTYHVSLKWM